MPMSFAYASHLEHRASWFASSYGFPKFAEVVFLIATAGLLQIEPLIVGELLTKIGQKLFTH